MTSPSENTQPTDETQIPVENQDENGTFGPSPEVELSMLKQRADMMGIKYSNRIGIEALREKINAKLEGRSEEPTEGAENETQEQVNALAPDKPVKKETLRQKLHREQMKLVRLRITNMNPKKANIPGEIITVGNRYLGTVRKYIPFGEATENGYHVPYCLYQLLKNRKFLHIREIKDRRTGTNRIETSWVREFALEELPPLTEAELKDLAIAQAAAGNID